MVVGFSQRIVLSRFLGMLSVLEPGALINSKTPFRAGCYVLVWRIPNSILS